MENSMEARVSAVITTLEHVLFEFHSEGGVFFNQSRLHKGFRYRYLCPTKPNRENNAAVSGVCGFLEFVSGH